MMRKHLGFSVNEWQSLPWWQQKLYIDQLSMDLAAERGDDPEEPMSFEDMAYAAADQRAAELSQEPEGDPDAYLRSMGFNV